MRGAGQSEVVSTAQSAARRAQCLCLLETLEFLQRVWPIGRAQALLGSALNIKPMIIVRYGEVHPLGRARTFPRALAKMQETVRGFAPLESLAVMHSTTPDLAHRVADNLRDVLPGRADPASPASARRWGYMRAPERLESRSSRPKSKLRIRSPMAESHAATQFRPPHASGTVAPPFLPAERRPSVPNRPCTAILTGLSRRSIRHPHTESVVWLSLGIVFTRCGTEWMPIQH